MFADDVCVFCPSVRWLQRSLDVCQAYAESHGIIFNCSKTACMTFKAKSAKSTATPVLKLGGQYVNYVDQCKYLGILLDTELTDDKDIQRQLRYIYCAANKLPATFSCCSNAVKNVLFRSFCTPMNASQLWCNFRESCMQRLRVAYNFGCKALYNLPWRASVSSHQAQCNIPTFEALLRKYKYCTCFSKGAENLTTYGYVLWCSQIVCTRHYSLNTIILLCDWVIELCSVRLIDGVSSHNAFAFYLD